MPDESLWLWLLCNCMTYMTDVPKTFSPSYPPSDAWYLYFLFCRYHIHYSVCMVRESSLFTLYNMTMRIDCQMIMLMTYVFWVTYGYGAIWVILTVIFFYFNKQSLKCYSHNFQVQIFLMPSLIRHYQNIYMSLSGSFYHFSQIVINCKWEVSIRQQWVNLKVTVKQFTCELDSSNFCVFNL